MYVMKIILLYLYSIYLANLLYIEKTVYCQLVIRNENVHGSFEHI